MDILIINFSIGAKLAKLLKGALGSSSALKIKLIRASLPVWISNFEEEFSKSILNGNPDLIALVLGAKMRAEEDAIIDYMIHKASNIPIIIFMENNNSDSSLVIKLPEGAIDFVVGPPSPKAILPLVWRILTDFS